MDIIALASPVLQKGRLRLVLKIFQDKMHLEEGKEKWSVECE